MLPNKSRGVPRVDDRRVISGIVHVLMSGGRWVDAPAITLAQAIGRSCGGRTTKLHAFVDGNGGPIALVVTPGQLGDHGRP